MVAYRFRWLGWFTLCVGVVLGCYMVSLQVASERKHLDDVNRQIAAAERSIRALETEFNTRASLAQLEAWNGDTLKLSAPAAQQFLPGSAALAQVDLHGGAPLGGAKVMTAAVIPSAPASAPVRHSAPPIVTASLQRQPAPAPRLIRAAATDATRTTLKPRLAMLERPLLSDSTLGDLVATAKAERRK